VAEERLNGGDGSSIPTWQHGYVTEFPFDTSRIPELGHERLRVVRENLPIGTTVLTINGPVVITSPYLRVLIPGAPPDDETAVFTYGFRVCVARGATQFPRSPNDPGVEVVAEIDVDEAEREDVLTIIDGVPTTREWYYYSVFYWNVGEDAERWALSPINGHCRQFALSQYLRDDSPTSKHGEMIYEMLPPIFRLAEDNSETTYRLCQIFGRILDAVEDEALTHLKSAVSINDVDASKLPYIDWLLAWPTNYELPEARRRRETAIVSRLWRQKGTKAALELFVQTVTGYRVTVYDGWRWVSSTPGGDDWLLDDPPPDWVEGVDGVWADVLRFRIPVTTFSPGMRASVDGIPRMVTTPSVEDVGGIGRPWSWRNPDGVMLVLREIPGVSMSFTAVLVQKIAKFVPVLFPHTASVTLAIVAVETENAEILIDDLDSSDEGLEFFADLDGVIDVSTFTFTPDFCTLHTFDGGGWLNALYYRTPHSALAYTCGDARVRGDGSTSAPRIGVIYEAL
jgi:phage tail-like protein